MQESQSLSARNNPRSSTRIRIRLKLDPKSCSQPNSSEDELAHSSLTPAPSRNPTTASEAASLLQSNCLKRSTPCPLSPSPGPGSNHSTQSKPKQHKVDPNRGMGLNQVLPEHSQPLAMSALSPKTGAALGDRPSSFIANPQTIHSAQDGKSPSTAFVVEDDDDEEDEVIASNDPLMLNIQTALSSWDDDSWCNASEVDAMFDGGAKSSGHFLASAWVLADQFAELVNRVSSRGPDGFIRLVHMNDIVEMLERFLENQAEFRREFKPCNVDVGYHYTVPPNLDRIKTDGLLSKSERNQRGIISNFNGSAYGDGIYTGNNPWDHKGKYGNVGLMVLRTKGRVSTNLFSVDTETTVDRLEPMDKIVVLKQSAQCVPIIQYDSSQIDPNDPDCKTNELLLELHQSIQHIVESSLHKQSSNDNVTLETSPFSLIQPLKGVQPARLGSIRYETPLLVGQNSVLQGVCQLVAPFASVGVCCVCTGLLGSASQLTARVEKCGHLIHLDCLNNALNYDSRCPVCRQDLDPPTPPGCMPAGVMEVSRNLRVTCTGYSWGTLHIKYSFNSGIQSEMHPSPGCPYEGTNRHAFLPDTIEGRILLSRLQEAFRNGLTFTIGTSQTTGKRNTIVWGLIPHKTNPQGGPARFGFPDEKYFEYCHQTLDALRVRPAGSDRLLREYDPIWINY